jgi:hypothetical protein
MNGTVRKLSNRLAIVVPLVALVVGAGITYMILATGATGKIKIEPNGTISVDLEPNDSFSDVLDKTVTADQEAANGVLESRGYYQLTSDRLVTILSEIDTDTDEGAMIARRLRQMLWNLEGPFRRPETLSGADGRMVQALDDLDGAIAGADEASDLLATLWEQNLDQRGIFLQRQFPASIKIVERAPIGEPRIYACSGGPLEVGRVIEIFTEIGSAMAPIEHSPALFSCDDRPISTRQLLTGKVTIPLGLNETAFKLAVDPDGSRGNTGVELDGTFVFYPRNLIGGS